MSQLNQGHLGAEALMASTLWFGRLQSLVVAWTPEAEHKTLHYKSMS